ncbi:MAG: V4R domain-containing protein [Cyanobacteria bacterium P01_G01_bin.39]
MIDIAALISESTLTGNYFAPDAYVQGDFESGLIENRQGKRLLALPDTLLKGLYNGLTSEVGSAAGTVLYNCGSKWGKNFWRRFSEEVEQFYQKSVAEMEMIELIQCLKQCWKAHGWGTIEPNFDYYQQGFLVVEIKQSAFASQVESSQQPSCYIEAGLLSAFFSELSGTNLSCTQTACESLGASSNVFILGLAKRLKPATDMIEQRVPHSVIMQHLCDVK